MSSQRNSYAVNALSHTGMFLFASVIALLFSFTISIPSVQAETITVSTADELMTALENAQGGETIELMPGEYGELSLSTQYGDPWAAFPSTVTITSTDGASPGFFSRVVLADVTNLTFDNVVFDYNFSDGDPHWLRIVEIKGAATNITIRNSEFNGDEASGTGDPARDGYGTGYGLGVDGRGGPARNITIENNTFHRWTRAGVFGGTDGFTVRNNEVYDIRSDGFDFASVDNVLIENNYFHDFRKSPESGDHMDMIQFWTNGTTDPSENITIRNNTLLSNKGDLTQSIFMRNEEVDTGRAGSEMFYQNLLIENNVIHNAHSHGISVGETDGLTIRNNTVLQNGDYPHGGVHTPKINVASASLNVTVTSNIAAAVPTAQSGWTVSDNLIVQRESAGQPNYYGDLFINALDDDLAELADLQALPGGLIETEGYGAALTRYDATPESLTALAKPEMVDGTHATYSFDAGYTAGPNGRVNETDGDFQWDFGDGSTGTGISTTHEYSAPGTYVVTLTATENGTSDATELYATVPDPLLLDVDVENATLLDTSSYAVPVNTNGLVFTDGRNTNEAVSLDADSGFSFSRGDIRHIYDLAEFSLSFGLRADAPGELMRIHTALHMNITSSGQLKVDLTNADEETFTLLTSESLLDGAWHNVTVTFDGIGGSMDVYVDGAHSATMAASGRTQPMEHWGLSVGVSWSAGFTGELDAFEMRSTALNASQIEEHHAMLTIDETYHTLGDTTDTTDTDGDGVPDSSDNCPNTPNADQTDTDNDGIGDVCDDTPDGGTTDSDADGIEDSLDNCPNTPNAAQTDSDADGIGDACDSTPYGGTEANSSFSAGERVETTDTINVRDPYGTDGTVLGTQNTGALGTVLDDTPVAKDGYTWIRVDFDTAPDGWVADAFLSAYSEPVDTDSDGVEDSLDNCPNTYNPDQVDTDGDGIGDACDASTGGGNNGVLEIDDRVETTDRLRVRDEPGLKSKTTAVRHVGDRGTVVLGPVSQDGYDWFGVDFDNGKDGWVAGEFLAEANQLALILERVEALLQTLTGAVAGISTSR